MRIIIATSNKVWAFTPYLPILKTRRAYATMLSLAVLLLGLNTRLWLPKKEVIEITTPIETYRESVAAAPVEHASMFVEPAPAKQPVKKPVTIPAEAPKKPAVQKKVVKPAVEASPKVYVPADADKAYMAYIKRFVATAQAEQKQFGIPASITLAQGLLESNAGQSVLAREANNHFGIKCFSTSCRKGHCMNRTDDSHKDFFRVYHSAWGSYRDHSKFLKGASRYKKCFKCGPTNYVCWAKGLKKAGYATARGYDEKLIGIIERYKLYRYD